MDIIIDSRERKPYTFADAAKHINSTTVEKLDTGDYTVRGCEDILCIDRKRSVGEVKDNILEDRFTAELERMRDFKYKYLLLEFSVEDVRIWPRGSGLPKHVQRKIRVSGNRILGRLLEIQLEYGVQVLFCGDRKHAEYMAVGLMKKVHDEFSNTDA